jgi:hypothetical protein
VGVVHALEERWGMRPDVDGELEGEQENLRKERRWNIPVPVRVQGLTAEGKEFDEETITADASPSGMCLLLTVQLGKGDQVAIAAAEEGFDAAASVVHVSHLGPNMYRVRVAFVKGKKFARAAAQKKYVYDYAIENWVGYICKDIYYTSKHEAFGKIEGDHILSLTAGTVLFTLRKGRAYDGRGNCIGHII